MKFGVNTWLWCSPFSMDHLNLLDKVKSFGYDSIEIAADDWNLIDCNVLHQRLLDVDLSVTVCGAFGPSRDLTNDDERVRENAIHYIIDSIRNTSRIGGRIFAGPFYSAVGKARFVDDEQRMREWERFIHGARRVAQVASDEGVVLCMEPLNRFETDLINTTQQAMQAIEEIDQPSVALHLDTFHMNVEEKNLAFAIRLAGSRLQHFHANENDRGVPGTGHIDWFTVGNALRDVEFQGYLTIESFIPGVTEIAKAASIWRSLAASPDIMAKEGLSFLKKVI